MLQRWSTLPVALFAVTLLVLGALGLRLDLERLFEGNEGSLTTHWGLDGPAFAVRASTRLPGFDECLARARQTNAGRPEGEFVGLEECAAILQASLEVAPADGEAWFEAARLELAQNGFTDRAFRMLELSYRYAPHELWISNQRLPMVLSAWAGMPASVRGRALEEIWQIANSWGGREALASIYLSLPEEVRPLMVIALEELPQETQQAFLSHFRRAVREEDAAAGQ